MINPQHQTPQKRQPIATPGIPGWLTMALSHLMIVMTLCFALLCICTRLLSFREGWSFKMTPHFPDLFQTNSRRIPMSTIALAMTLPHEIVKLKPWCMNTRTSLVYTDRTTLHTDITTADVFVVMGVNLRKQQLPIILYIWFVASVG